jgi:CBS domain-containing protein
MTVERLMRRDVPAASPALAVSTLVYEHLIPGDDRALPVVHDDRLVGLVTIADIRGVPSDRWAVTTVGSIMRPRDELYVTSPDEDLSRAFEQLARRDIGQLPVEQDGRFVGMLRRRDVTRWLELAWRPARDPTDRRGPTGGASIGSRSHDRRPSFAGETP